MTPTHPTRLGALAGSMTRSVRGAAMTFSQIVSERVGMSVSHVALADRDSLQRSLCALDEFSGGRLCVVTQRMRTADGQAAEALLALPEEGALLIVRRMLGLADVSDELTELEQDALAEAGSIVIDACSGGLAGAFGWKVEATQPRVALSSRECGFGVDESLQNALVTHLHIHLSGLRVEGRVVLEMVADTALPAASPYPLSA